MTRSIVTVSLLVALLGNGVWTVRCNSSEPPSGAIVAANTDPELPECCRNGICPHHSGEHHAAQSKDADDSCVCQMSSRDFGSLTFASLAAAVLSTTDLRIDLLASGAAPSVSLPDTDQPELSSDTPPPRT